MNVTIRRSHQRETKAGSEEHSLVASTRHEPIQGILKNPYLLHSQNGTQVIAIFPRLQLQEAAVFWADDRPVDSASPYYFVDGIIRTEDFNKNISLLQKIQKKVKLIRAN